MISEKYLKNTKKLDKVYKLLSSDPNKGLALAKEVIIGYKADKVKCKELYLNLGNAYRIVGDIPSAMKCYAEAASSSTPSIAGSFGDYPSALNNLGLMHYALGNDATAVEYYNKCLEKDPRHFDAVWNYANAVLRYLSNGGSEFDEWTWSNAWKAYSFRFKRSVPTRIDTRIKFWNGEPTSEDAIVVLAEQGFGDKIMFGRYLSMLPFSRVVVQCDPSQAWFFREYETCTDPIASGCKLAIPFCSLAAVLDPTVTVAPEWIGSGFDCSDYLYVEWAGSASHANNVYRSSSWAEFSKLPGMKVNCNPSRSSVRGLEWIGGLGWEDQCKIIGNSRAVVTVDTSTAHIAASLGKKVYMIQPLLETDFRWGHGYSKWYPNVEIIENKGWDSAICTVIKKLDGDRVGTC
jgi:hypothetical protein